MSEWIELNLPFSIHEYYDSTALKFPNLKRRAKKELGFDLKDIDALYHQVSFDYNDARVISDKIIDKIKAKLDQKYEHASDEWRASYVAKLLQSKNKDVQATGAWLEKKYAYDKWIDIQPEVIAYHKKFEEKSTAFHKEIAKKSFSGLGLCRPGVLIEIQSGDEEARQYLIGHINTLAGVCDDCVEFDKRNVVVKRYQIVWSEEEK